MKVILTGSTGTVGSAVLQRCLSHPKITSVVALTRRPLDVQDPKLNNIIHKDFLKYDEKVIDQLKGAEACIWYVSFDEIVTRVERRLIATAGRSAHQHLAKKCTSTTP